MSPRSNYIPVNQASQGVGGSNNKGIIIVRNRKSGKQVIEKRVSSTHVRLGLADREIKLMRQCGQHPNIVECVAYDTEWSVTGYGSLFLQRAELGSLDSVIERFAQRKMFMKDSGFAWKVLWDMALALCFLRTGVDASAVRMNARAGHSVERRDGWDFIIHRDIKPSNIFLTWKEPNHGSELDQYPTVVLGDFGCAVTMSQYCDGNIKTGNDRDFAPPEGSESNETGDVYSLAVSVVCLLLMEQEVPRGDLFSKTAWITPVLKSVLTPCLDRNMDQRPRPQDLPSLVWRAYKTWSSQKNLVGEPLPCWATGCTLPNCHAGDCNYSQSEGSSVFSQPVSPASTWSSLGSSPDVQNWKWI